ncbi:MAG: TIGR03905 family TSCPD domain-containing protein [Oscillospiraceae bacterium]|nr:TIGR03905 family TSCPD domain-containing protein [Oscillospiraceae bacterium]
MDKIIYTPRGVCSRQIEVVLDGDIIKRVEFAGGCMGNTQGVARLVEGMTVEEAVTRLEGIECGRKGTSCPDQLAKAIIELVKKRK